MQKNKSSNSKYARCKKCRELVIDAENCANCANRNPMNWKCRQFTDGKRGSPTLDIQEGNSEESF